MAKEKKETIETKQKIILPPSGDNETDQELIDNFLSHTDEEYRQMGEEIEEAERKVEEEEKKNLEIPQYVKDFREICEKRKAELQRNLNPEKMSNELPEYTKQVKENFLNLKGIDKDKLEKIDKLVSEMESKGYINRCSFEGGLMVLMEIPGYTAFKYFEPDFRKHSINGNYRGRFGPYSEEVPSKLGGVEVMKNEVKYGGIGLLPIRTSRDERENYTLYYYLANTMKENNFSFVSFQHDRKFLKILGEYYRKETGDNSITVDELVAMRTRVLLSCGLWLEKQEGGFNSGMIECSDDKCGFDFFGLHLPNEFDYISFFLTDLKLLPEDYADGHSTTNI